MTRFPTAPAAVVDRLWSKTGLKENKWFAAFFGSVGVQKSRSVKRRNSNKLNGSSEGKFYCVITRTRREIRVAQSVDNLWPDKR